MADYASLLRDHITLKCRCIDRIFLQAYVPKLQTVGQVCQYLRWNKGYKIPSSAAFGQIGQRYVKQIHEFTEQRAIPVIRFEKGQKKEAVAEPYLKAAAKEGQDRVALIGIAQEKSSAWRSWKAKGQERAAHPHMEWGRQMAFVNHFYFYLWDGQWGKTFWKTNAYAPYPIWLWLNGHEWAKRQLHQAGIGYRALDNGFRECEDPDTLQEICDRLGPSQVQSFFRKWLLQLPSPFDLQDWLSGIRYDLAFRQFEVSETLVFDRPQAGRMWFEGVIRDHLDVGRPEQISLVFNRRVNRRTPGRFRTRVLTEGVDPTLTCYYKSSRLKQYFKQGRALRTETVICDSRDFGVGRLVCDKNWYALRAVGEDANRRLCEAEAVDARPAPDVLTFEQVSRPSRNKEGLTAPGLRFGDPRVMAVFATLVSFMCLLQGFDNQRLVAQVSALLNSPYTSRQATYDLRRLKRKGLILKIPGKRRYRLTPYGRSVAVLFLKTYGRVLAPGLTALDLRLPESIARRCPLATAWRNFDRTLDEFVQKQIIAA